MLLVPEPGKKRERERGWFDLRSSGEERGLLSRTAAGAMESPSLYKKALGTRLRLAIEPKFHPPFLSLHLFFLVYLKCI